MSQAPENSDWQILAAQQPPIWEGDLDDDCTAHWAGFMLRAEQMDEDCWWWCVYVDGSSEQIASSNNLATPPSTGEAARNAAETAARTLLGL